MSTSISATEIGLPDNAKLKLGTGEDLELYHDGSHSYIDNTGTGNLYIKDAGIVRVRTASFGVDNADGSEALLSATANGAVELYHNNSKKFETTTDGVQVTGEVVSGTLHCSGKLDLPDSPNATVGRVLLGTGDDLQIYFDGSNSFIKEPNSVAGQLIIDGYNGTDIRQGATGELMGRFLGGGAVELYHDNTKKLSTNADGIEVHGSTDSARIEFGDAYSNSRIGYFGLNRFGIDGHDGLEVRDPSASYAVRMRITATGQFKAFSDQASGNGQLFQNVSSTNPEGLYIKFTQAAPNTQSRHFIKCSDNVGDKAVIDSNGNSRNLNNSYGGFSDISLKENIVDAGSQWDDIKNVKVRVFNFKTDSASEKRIGVVAQEIETVCPKLVGITYDKDEDGNMLETGVKSVKYSVLYMKAIKALQEAIIKIEVLETKVETLEAA